MKLKEGIENLKKAGWSNKRIIKAERGNVKKHPGLKNDPHAHDYEKQLKKEGK